MDGNPSASADNVAAEPKTTLRRVTDMVFLLMRPQRGDGLMTQL